MAKFTEKRPEVMKIGVTMLIGNKTITGKFNLQMAISAGSIFENNYSKVQFGNDH